MRILLTFLFVFAGCGDSSKKAPSVVDEVDMEFDMEPEPEDPCRPSDSRVFLECPTQERDCLTGWEVFELDCGCGCVRIPECRDGGDRFVDYSGCAPGQECPEVWVEFSDPCGCGCIRQPSKMCRAMDAVANGNCNDVLGTTFDGIQCETLTGCVCEGADCNALYTSFTECQRVTGDCVLFCGDPELVVCDEFADLNPADCPEGSMYTVIECEPMCVSQLDCTRVP